VLLEFVITGIGAPRLQVNTRVQTPGGSGEMALGPKKLAHLSVKGNDCTEVPCGAHSVFMVKPLMTVVFVLFGFTEQTIAWR
jgi:hypothetical protein